MIVRISGHGQFDLDDGRRQELEALDPPLTEALHAGQETRFHALLQQVIDYVEQHGKRLPDEHMTGSDIIVPPEDVSMAEAQSFFTNEGLLHPVQA